MERAAFKTPYYLIDERRLSRNLATVRRVKKISGAKIVLALKCFSTWSVFGVLRDVLDGTTTSSPYEVRLGREKFGKEVHAYSVAYSREDIEEVRPLADKFIFNSVGQLERFAGLLRGRSLGLRVNPGVSYSHFDLADPARKHSRLGVVDRSALCRLRSRIDGVMFHFNCENDDLASFARHLAHIERGYGDLLKGLSWVSLGGGIYFTKAGYPVEKFSKLIRDFGRRYGVLVYLEPGESVITGAAELVTTVLDIVHNERDIAIVDASTEAHMLDLLIYRIPAKMARAERGPHRYLVAGRSCLAGDVFGTYRFKSPLRVGSVLKFADAAGYTMVKKNWFNGLRMPSIVVRKRNGSLRLVRRFTYKDFLSDLS